MPLAPWAIRAITWAAAWTAEEVARYALEQRLDAGDSANPPGAAIRKAQLVFARGHPGGVNEDVAVTSLHLVNITDGQVDDTWTDADFVTCENAIKAWWNAIKLRFPDETVFREIRWYREGPGIVPPNPAARVVAVNLAGTGAGSQGLPPQVSVTLTLKTAIRRRWGRMYLPSTLITSVSEGGLVSQTVTVDLANFTEDLFETLAAADFVPVVWSPTAQKAYGVNELQVDDLFDVVRSRRWASPTRRDKRPLPPP